MQHRSSIWKLGLVGTCLAFASSFLVFAQPASAATHETDPVRQEHFRHIAVYLSGKELRDGGDSKGWGMARLDFDPDRETVCYLLSWRDLDGVVTAFHLHAAPRGHDGPHWVDFFNGQHFDGKWSDTSGCVHTPRGKILDVINAPSDYYVNVHTSAHKEGSLRGQLF